MLFGVSLNQGFGYTGNLPSKELFEGRVDEIDIYSASYEGDPSAIELTVREVKPGEEDVAPLALAVNDLAHFDVGLTMLSLGMRRPKSHFVKITNTG